MERKFSAAVWNHRWHFIIAVHWSLPSEHPKSTWREMVTKFAYKPVGLLIESYKNYYELCSLIAI